MAKGCKADSLSSEWVACHVQSWDCAHVVEQVEELCTPAARRPARNKVLQLEAQHAGLDWALGTALETLERIPCAAPITAGPSSSKTSESINKLGDNHPNGAVPSASCNNQIMHRASPQSLATFSSTKFFAGTAHHGGNACSRQPADLCTPTDQSKHSTKADLLLHVAGSNQSAVSAEEVEMNQHSSETLLGTTAEIGNTATLGDLVPPGASAAISVASRIMDGSLLFGTANLADVGPATQANISATAPFMCPDTSLLHISALRPVQAPRATAENEATGNRTAQHDSLGFNRERCAMAVKSESPAAMLTPPTPPPALPGDVQEGSESPPAPLSEQYSSSYPSFSMSSGGDHSEDLAALEVAGPVAEGTESQCEVCSSIGMSDLPLNSPGSSSGRSSYCPLHAPKHQHAEDLVALGCRAVSPGTHHEAEWLRSASKRPPSSDPFPHECPICHQPSDMVSFSPGACIVLGVSTSNHAPPQRMHRHASGTQQWDCGQQSAASNQPARWPLVQRTSRRQPPDPGMMEELAALILSVLGTQQVPDEARQGKADAATAPDACTAQQTFGPLEHTGTQAAQAPPSHPQPDGISTSMTHSKRLWPHTSADGPHSPEDDPKPQAGIPDFETALHAALEASLAAVIPSCPHPCQQQVAPGGNDTCAQPRRPFLSVLQYPLPPVELANCSQRDAQVWPSGCLEVCATALFARHKVAEHDPRWQAPELSMPVECPVVLCSAKGSTAGQAAKASHVQEHVQLGSYGQGTTPAHDCQFPRSKSQGIQSECRTVQRDNGRGNLGPSDKRSDKRSDLAVQQPVPCPLEVKLPHHLAWRLGIEETIQDAHGHRISVLKCPKRGCGPRAHSSSATGRRGLRVHAVTWERGDSAWVSTRQLKLENLKRSSEQRHVGKLQPALLPVQVCHKHKVKFCWMRAFEHFPSAAD
jgi:hypothetical protein